MSATQESDPRGPGAAAGRAERSSPKPVAGWTTLEAGFTDTERSVGGLRNEVAGLDKMRSTVDTFRQEVEQLTSSMSAIESRRGPSRTSSAGWPRRQ